MLCTQKGSPALLPPLLLLLVLVPETQLLILAWRICTTQWQTCSGKQSQLKLDPYIIVLVFSQPIPQLRLQHKQQKSISTKEAGENISKEFLDQNYLLKQRTLLLLLLIF